MAQIRNNDPNSSTIHRMSRAQAGSIAIYNLHQLPPQGQQQNIQNQQVNDQNQVNLQQQNQINQPNQLNQLNQPNQPNQQNQQNQQQGRAHSKSQAQWVCDTCTFINSNESMKCGFCNALKIHENIRYSITNMPEPEGQITLPQQQNIQNIEQQPSKHKIENSNELNNLSQNNENNLVNNENIIINNNNNNNNIENEEINELQPPNVQWTCTICTLLNKAGTQRCRACGGQHPFYTSISTNNPTINKHLGLHNNSSNNNSGSFGTNNNSGGEEDGYFSQFNAQNAFWQDSNISVFSGDSHNSGSSSGGINNNIRIINKNKGVTTVDDLHRVASEICCMNANPQPIFHTLRTVTRKLLRDDLKYRTLDTTNPKVTERLLGFEGVLDFLTLLGFESDLMNYKLICKEKPKQGIIDNALEILTSYENQLSIGKNPAGPTRPKETMDDTMSELSFMQSPTVLGNNTTFGLTDSGMTDSGNNNYGNNNNPLMDDSIQAQNKALLNLQRQRQQQQQQNQQNQQNQPAQNEDNNELTLEQIILWSTHENSRDSDTMKTLIMTHKTFTDSLTLLNALRRRFWQVLIPNEIMNDSEKKKDFQNNVQKRIQLKVIKAIRDWMKYYWDSDFSGDNDENKIRIRHDVKEWVNSMIENEIEQRGGPWNKPIAQRLLVEFERNCEKGGLYKKPLIKDYLKMDNIILPNDFDGFKQCTANEIADQITLMDYDIFEKIEARECLGQAWKKKNKWEVSPNILRLIDRFNYISKVVQFMVLEQNGLKNRCKLLKKMIKIGERLRKLRNYNSLCAVWSGLNATAVFRLKVAWERLPSKFKILFNQFGIIYLRDGNSNNMRHLFRNASPPIIPHLGLFLQDLVFIDDGNQKVIDVNLPEANKMVNFNKSVRVADRTKSILLYQQEGYDKIINENQILGKYLSKLIKNAVEDYDDDKLWNLSEKCKISDQKEIENNDF